MRTDLKKTLSRVIRFEDKIENKNKNFASSKKIKIEKTIYILPSSK